MATVLFLKRFGLSQTSSLAAGPEEETEEGSARDSESFELEAPEEGEVFVDVPADVHMEKVHDENKYEH